MTASRAYAFGAFRLLDSERRLVLDGRPVALPPRAFDVLLALTRRSGHLVTKDELVRDVWSGAFIEEGTVTRTVSVLRQALAAGGAERWIETVSKFGYRFAAPVETIPGSASASLAVLPFRRLGEGEPFGPLGVGLADALISRLGRQAEVSVRPTSAVLRFATPERDSLAAAATLGVDFVLDGLFQEEGERIAVSWQLVRTDDGTILWSERREEPLGSLFQLQESLAQRVGRELAPRLAGEIGVAARSPAPDVPGTQAARLYLEGRFHLYKYHPEALDKALRCFRRAAAESPAWPLAWAGLSDALLIGSDSFLPAPAAIAEAREATGRALRLDPELPEAVRTRAAIRFWHDWERRAAEDDYRRALELGPSNAFTHQCFAWFLLASGRLEEAREALAGAFRLDPLSAGLRVDLGLPSYFARRFEDAIERFREGVELEPAFWYGHYWQGLALGQLGDAERAIAGLTRARELAADGVPELVPALAAAQALAGRREEAGALIREASERAAATQRSLGFDLAIARLALGQPDQALSVLDDACTRREKWMSWIRVEPRLDALRGEPGFAAIVRRAGF